MRKLDIRHKPQTFRAGLWDDRIPEYVRAYADEEGLTIREEYKGGKYSALLIHPYETYLFQVTRLSEYKLGLLGVALNRDSEMMERTLEDFNKRIGVREIIH
jgi:hypothetical protein